MRVKLFVDDAIVIVAIVTIVAMLGGQSFTRPMTRTSRSCAAERAQASGKRMLDHQTFGGFLVFIDTYMHGGTLRGQLELYIL
jgi:hypothetical protein